VVDVKFAAVGGALTPQRAASEEDTERVLRTRIEADNAAAKKLMVELLARIVAQM
jgi:hypothetical protein